MSRKNFSVRRPEPICRCWCLLSVSPPPPPPPHRCSFATVFTCASLPRCCVVCSLGSSPVLMLLSGASLAALSLVACGVWRLDHDPSFSSSSLLSSSSNARNDSTSPAVATMTTTTTVVVTSAASPTALRTHSHSQQQQQHHHHQQQQQQQPTTTTMTTTTIVELEPPTVAWSASDIAFESVALAVAFVATLIAGRLLCSSSLLASLDGSRRLKYVLLRFSPVLILFPFRNDTNNTGESCSQISTIHVTSYYFPIQNSKCIDQTISRRLTRRRSAAASWRCRARCGGGSSARRACVTPWSHRSAPSRQSRRVSCRSRSSCSHSACSPVSPV
jgi:hypothetical protein